ncbi:hypothetical protein [Paraburkholderia silvatlantica]|uniref:Uncharacterized protein n=1 Tax=Paraburkholderia silvatlantica TaxID=321895 RepID=A0ABR6FRX6_9BURK|nr:hypothetical protein [Paraburkholderia silvatlantica]MBB2930146.1 hypothetical protein [Paraburkholderia silvatlantica]PVY22487.1 hypothetical protein C7411_13187 [Paraburkholderia silvatlantica]PXW28956.1 hypothetical protein C7413_13187 [Paraburkholderia silvatlantica]
MKHDSAKKPNGRPAFLPTKTQREIVCALLACGVPHDLCRLHVINPETHRPLNYRTFVRAFEHEIQTAVTMQCARVTQNLYRIAVGDSPQAVQAAMFWLRCRAGWRAAEPEDVKPPLDGPPRTFTSEAEVEAHVKELIERYGRRSRTN